MCETWLREADFHISPTKADYVSTCGLEVFRRFKALNPEMGFAQSLGVLVNMKDAHSTTDDEYHRWLAGNADNLCFEATIPRMAALQDAARFQIQDRSYQAKYPGDSGKALKAVTIEILGRMAAANLEAPARRT